MEFFKKFDFKPLTILKIVGVAVISLILIVFALRLIGSSFQSLTGSKGLNQSARTASFYPKMDFDDYEKGGAIAQELSVRNIASGVNPRQNYSTGEDAEDFEVTEYRATIKTRKLDSACSVLSELKVNDGVIFESVNKHDHGCYYSFKVKNDQVEKVLAVIEDLNPEELSENIFTIKQLVDDFTSEVEILEKKKVSIEETLENAISAYDQITVLATKVQDVESLAKIIDSKIRIIEKLTQEKIRINEQLDRLSRAKANQLDRIEYTYFNVSVYENKYVDFENIKNSWQSAIKEFVRDTNDILQDVTVGLLALFLRGLQVVLYLFILLVVVKYSWRFARYLWKK